MVPCSPSCLFSTPVPFFPCSSYSSLKGSRLAAPPQVLQSLCSSVSSWKSFPLSLHGWLFLVLPFSDLLVFPYGRLLGLLSNWLSSNYQITTYIFHYFCYYEESAISSICSRSWIWLWGGMRNLELEKSLQNHPHGTELEAKRKCTFSGENNVERTEILHFTLLPKNLLWHIPFMTSWSVACFLRMIIR